MRIAVPFVVLVVSWTLVGCGNSPAVVPGAKNNGNMIPLADKKGFIEIRLDATATAKGSGGRGQVEPRSIVVFFYGPDGSTSMSPAPTDVSLKISGAETVALMPREADGSFASKAGDFPDGFRGVLSAKVGGEPVEATVAVR